MFGEASQTIVARRGGNKYFRTSMHYCGAHPTGGAHCEDAAAQLSVLKAGGRRLPKSKRVDV